MNNSHDAMQVPELRILGPDAGSNLFNYGQRYEIPLYQRPFAWKEEHITRLIEDVMDIDASGDQTYYLGSLVVWEKTKNLYEVVDGQQRLTTLFLILSALGENVSFGKSPALSFSCRDKSDYTLSHLETIDVAEKTEEKLIENGIATGYRIVKAKLSESDFDADEFREKLRRTCVYRIEVPKDTDLNHYFEIMNTRGEQLEQHEVLKASLMKHLSERDAAAFAAIWDACSDMSCYVQMRFKPSVRERLFGWNYDWVPSDEAINSIDWDSENGDSMSIEEITAARIAGRSTNDEDENGISRFESIIDFTYFLHHVLRVFVRTQGITGVDGDVLDRQLDDKKLIESFDRVCESGVWEGRPVKEDLVRFARSFANCLLRVRFLFDKCIIKREFIGEEAEGQWSLKELHRESSKSWKPINTRLRRIKGQWESTMQPTNKQALMLQSCLRVSYTSPKVMHWITDLLCALVKIPDLHSSEDFLYRIEDVARNAVRRFIENGDYSLGVATPHIVLNYLDYRIWLSDKGKYSDFVFEFRTSVEHWYPQHPSVDSFQHWNDVDRFGNLCLVQRNVNSKFSNLHPLAKKSTYGEMIEKGSLKLRLMADLTDDDNHWIAGKCQEHEQEMLSILRDACCED